MIEPIGIANLTDPISSLPADRVDRTVRSVISEFLILASQLAVIDQDDVIIRIDLFNLIQLTDSDLLNGVVEMMLQPSSTLPKMTMLPSVSRICPSFKLPR